MAVPSIAAVPGGLASARRGDRVVAHRDRRPAGSFSRRRAISSSLFTSCLLLLLGIVPAVYAIYLALIKSTSGFGHSGGFGSSFIVAFKDYRIEYRRSSTSASSWPSWLVSQTIFVVALALLLHNLDRRVGTCVRFVFYIPGALAGAASVVVWLFMLDPTASPLAFVLHWFGFRTSGEHGRARPPAGYLRDHGVLDGRRRMDRRDVRRAQQHPPRAARVGRDRRGERLQDRAAGSSSP